MNESIRFEASISFKFSDFQKIKVLISQIDPIGNKIAVKNIVEKWISANQPSKILNLINLLKKEKDPASKRDFFKEVNRFIENL